MEHFGLGSGALGPIAPPAAPHSASLAHWKGTQCGGAEWEEGHWERS